MLVLDACVLAMILHHDNVTWEGNRRMSGVGRIGHVRVIDNSDISTYRLTP